jgi:hypothetical protein
VTPTWISEAESAAVFLLVIVRHIPGRMAAPVHVTAPSQKKKLRLYSALFAWAIGLCPSRD